MPALEPYVTKLRPTTADIETLLRREVCEPRFWAAIYSWSEGAKSAHFDSGKLSSAKFGTCVVGETRLIQRADRAHGHDEIPICQSFPEPTRGFTGVSIEVFVAEFPCVHVCNSIE